MRILSSKFFITFPHNRGRISSTQRLISSRNARVVAGSSTWTFHFEQPRKKKSNGVKSRDPGGRFRSPKRESARPGNVSRGNRIVWLAARHVAPSRRNRVSAASMSSNFGRKNRVIASRYRAPLTVAARPASCSKKYGPMTPPGQNPRQNGDALRVRSFFANRAWLLRTPNAAILPINEAVEVKTRFVA